MDRAFRGGTIDFLGVALLLAALFGAAENALAQGDDKPDVAKALQLQAAENNHVAIPKAGLGKEYILSASLIPQTLAATSTALGGRIVIFERFGDKIDMYESTQGQVVTEDLPSRLLYTSFPIVKENDDSVVIDFNAGMNSIFTDIWYGDLDTFSLSMDQAIPVSRVFDVESKRNRLLIRQSAQVRSRGMAADFPERYEVRYFVSPYVANGFQDKESDHEFKYVGFFETGAHLEPTTGRRSNRIARFDLREPIQFYVSNNTPKEYVRAVKDGVLYWNKAFGKEIVKVDMAPEGITAPDADHNVIQWVPWDNAGFAYADIIVDPRSGESLHGQAYMTSVFAIGSIQRARMLLRQLRSFADAEEKKDDDDDGDDDDGHRLGGLAARRPGPRSLGFLRPTASCWMDPRERARQMADSLEQLLAEGHEDDNRVLRMSQDYVCEVVAHEVGHVVGLRHNFAASVAGTINHESLRKWFKSYMTQDAPEKIEGLPATSVMEYNGLMAAVYLGAYIRTEEKALPYDEAAIRWGYFDDNKVIDEKTLFGTDDHVGTYGDVNRFDYGADPVVSAYAEMEETLRTMPNTLIEAFIARKAPFDPRDKRPLEQVDLNVQLPARQISTSLARLLSWFDDDTRSLRIERQLDFVGDLNEEEILKKRWEQLNEGVEKLGGIDRIFAHLPVDLKLSLDKDPQGVGKTEKFDAGKMAEKVAKLLDEPQYKDFIGLDGKKYQFTDEEKKLIKERAQKFFDLFEEALLKATLDQFAEAHRDLGLKANKSLGDDDIVSKLETRIVELAREVVLQKNEDKRIKGKVDQALVEVVDYKYRTETRLAAAKTLANDVGSYSAWCEDSRSKIHEDLKKEVDSALGINNLKEFKEDMLSRPLRQWYLEQKSVLGAIPSK